MFWEIFSLLTGIAYMLLELKQHNFMWIVGILTALASMIVFWGQGLYASFVLNGYYLVVSFVGLWQWKKDAEKVSDQSAVRVRKLSWKIVLLSLAAFAVLFFAFGALARYLGDPMSGLDVAVAVLSAIATVWLARCYREQWLLWIVADSLSIVLCAMQELWWMTALYSAYTLTAIFGAYHWWKNGEQLH